MLLDGARAADWLRSSSLWYDVNVRDFDGVVSVTESVPGWDLGLHVAGGVGCSDADGVSTDVGRGPVEGPVLPLVGAFGGFELSRVPVAGAGEAEVDAG